MTESIEQTIKRVLDNYDLPVEAVQVTDQVVAALTQRENQIAEDLYNAAVSSGYGGAHEVREAMVASGIQFRLPGMGGSIDTASKDEISDMIDRRIADWKRELGL